MSMTYQKMTIEEYRQERSRDPLDAQGNLINIGDEIEMLEDYYVEKGSIGIVRCYYTSGHDFGVEFELKSSSTHNLDGLINTDCGLYVSSKQIRLIKTSISVDEETHIKNLIEEAKTEPKLALIDGKFYRLNLEAKATADTLVETLMSAVSRRVAQIRVEANSKVQAAEEKLRQSLVMPNVTLEEVKKGMTIYKNDSCLIYRLPLYYAPKFIGSDASGQVTDEISSEHQAQLKQNVLLEVYVDKASKVQFVGTCKPNHETFSHYHGNLNNCTGTIKLIEVKTPADVFVFRDKLQEALTIVNWRSPYDFDPPGMPTIDQLQEAAKHIETKEAWGNTDVITVGNLVKILAEQDSSNNTVGLIVKVVRIQNEWVGVEFLDPISFGHDSDHTGKRGYCYNYTLEKVELMPPGTKRTRRKVTVTMEASWAGEEEEEEHLEPTFATPEDEEFAKFGVRGQAIRDASIDAICRRCGQPRGEHYNNRNPSICPDEQRAGREVDNLNIHVARTWVREPYQIGPETVAA